MFTTTESLNAATTESVQLSAPTIHEQAETDFSTSMVCDLGEARAFSLSYAAPNVPVLAAFGGGQLHSFKLEGSWDLDKAASENAAALFRSIRRPPSKDAVAKWDDLTFQFGPQAYLYANEDQIVAFAITPIEAERLVARFAKAYTKPPDPAGGIFYLIQQNSFDISCHTVSLPPDTVLSEEALSLHYGSGSGGWHQQFLESFNEKDRGLSIFEGSPGTGKTCYLRHLTGVLKDSHRFYFIPPANMGVLSRPDFIGFWANQRRQYSNRKFVVILEDSEAALMTRGSDNREHVSAILNLSDGMLADFLRLQIICTINCTADDIDPALLRPGRLLCHRVFGRLNHPDAVRLAESLGRKLPLAHDYSLAEVFAGNGTNEIDRPHIGFATQSDHANGTT